MQNKREVKPRLNVTVTLQEFDEKEWPGLAVYTYSRSGRLLDKQPLRQDPKQPGKGTAILNIETYLDNVVVKVGPDVESQKDLQRIRLSVQSVNLSKISKVDFIIVKPFWKCWIRMPYFVTGNVKKYGPHPMSPICAGEVDIYEVDPVWCIWQLPEIVIERLRQAVIDIIADPPRMGLPPLIADNPFNWWNWSDDEYCGTVPRPPFPNPKANILDLLRGLPKEWAFSESRYLALENAWERMDRKLLDMDFLQQRSFLDSEAVSGVKISQLLHTNTKQFREILTDHFPSFRYILCWWPWIYWIWWPYCSYAWKKVGTATLQPDGSFSKIIWRSICDKDKPDLWFVVRQKISGVERVIYERHPVPCNTYWNHPGGSPVTLIVTDPQAVACQGPGVYEGEEFIMPMGIYEDEWYEIDQAHIKSAVNPHVPLPQNCGLKSGADPYGTRLDFRMMLHDGLRTSMSATNGVRYYRWSYRLHGDSQWIPIDTPIVHRYLHEQAPGDYTVLQETLGPVSVGGKHQLFAIPDPEKAWLNNRDDLAFAIWNTAVWNATYYRYDPVVPNGKYDLKLEAFDKDANLLNPATAGFKFMLMTGATGPVDDALFVESDGSLIMHLHVENRPMRGSLKAIRLNSVVTGDCQFLEYTNKYSDNVHIDYEAYHPATTHDFLMGYHIRIRRGTSGAIKADHNGTSAVRPPGATFSNSVGVLLSASPADYEKCAFSATLHVTSRIRDGHGYIRAYEADDIAAFAIVPEV